MNQVTSILHQLPPHTQLELHRALTSAANDANAKLMCASDLRAMGIAQGQAQIINTLLSGLGSTQ